MNPEDEFHEAFPLKKCTRCGVEFEGSLAHFKPEPRSPDGLRSQCFKCYRTSERESKRARLLAMGPEKRKEKAQAHYRKYRASILAKSRAWAKANPEKARATRQAYHTLNREARNAARKKRAEAQPEQRAAQSREQYLRRMAADPEAVKAYSHAMYLRRKARDAAKKTLS